MRRLLTPVILTAFLLIGGSLHAFTLEMMDRDLINKLEASANQLINSQANGDGAVRPEFKAAWQQQLDTLGTLERIGPAVIVHKNDEYLCNMALTFSGGTIVQHTVFDEQHRIIGLSFLPDPLSSVSLPPEDVTTKLEALAKQLTNYLAAGDEAAALALMDTAMQKKFKGKLNAVWQQRLDKLGTLERIGPCILVPKNDQISGTMTLTFSGGSVVQQTVFDKDHRIASLSFMLETPN